MPKNEQELNELKKNEELDSELNDDELVKVAGGDIKRALEGYSEDP